MVLIVVVAVGIVVWAAFISISASVQPLDKTSFIATTVLALGVAIQRINGVQRWLSKPKRSRQDQTDVLAQQILIDICLNRTVSRELLDLSIHVWEVPLWYRRIVPYTFRISWKSLVTRRFFRMFARWTVRPAMRRVVALGLVKQAPSGVRFRKGLGLIGVCVANNDRSEFITLNTSSRRYQNALNSPSEAVWAQQGAEITHNLRLADAKKLSGSYGQVIAKVVQDMDSGEAIGCVTISAKGRATPTLNFAQDELFKDSATTLALGVARILA